MDPEEAGHKGFWPIEENDTETWMRGTLAMKQLKVKSRRKVSLRKTMNY